MSEIHGEFPSHYEFLSLSAAASQLMRVESRFLDARNFPDAWKVSRKLFGYRLSTLEVQHERWKRVLNHYQEISVGNEKNEKEKGKKKKRRTIQSINEKLDGVHLVTGFVFVAHRSRTSRELSRLGKLVVSERRTEAVKDLEPAVNGPRQFAFATRRSVFQDFCFPSSVSPCIFSEEK